MPVLYDGKKIIPVAGIGIEKEYQRGENGSLRRVQYIVTCALNLVAHKGSPDADGIFWTGSGYPPDTPDIVASDPDKRLAILRNKKGAIDQLFCTKGKLFEVQPFDGSAPIKFIPRIRNISFAQGQGGSADWFTKIPVTITMETDRIDFGAFVLCAGDESLDNDVDETWQIEPNDDKGRTYKIIHNVSASARDEYDAAGTGSLLRQGWVVARDDKVAPKLGFDTAIRDGSQVANLSGFNHYNYVKNENIDESGGKYSITESWILYDGGNYLEEYNVSTRTNSADGLVSVTVDGTITGFSTASEPGIGDRFTNAEAGFTTVSSLIITRAQALSGVTLNASTINKTVGKNPLAGTVTYNYEYNNQPSATISGAISENVTINDSLPTARIATHICVLRAIGPVLQDIGTQTESRRSITIEVQMPAQTQTFTPTEPDVTSLIIPYIPVANFQGPYIDKNEKSWNARSGRYTRNISFLWV